MRKKKPSSEDSTVKIVGGAIGAVIGAVLFWLFIVYGLAALAAHL